MTGQTLTVAIVGHTNVGKTSLLRTLTRDSAFGDVAARPGTTRSVEAATIPVGEGAIVLFDTPGLEDSPAVRAHLQAEVDSGQDWVEAIAHLSDGA
ncbi:MAG: GTPase domain-containing protein, partial [Pseudomonadota bacterium]